MRASIGFRVGPLYLGTGNLLRTRRRRRRGPSLAKVIFAYPFIGMWFLFAAVYWWFPLYTFRGARWAIREAKTAHAARQSRSAAMNGSRPGGY